MITTTAPTIRRRKQYSDLMDEPWPRPRPMYTISMPLLLFIYGLIEKFDATIDQMHIVHSDRSFSAHPVFIILFMPEIFIHLATTEYYHGKCWMFRSFARLNRWLLLLLHNIQIEYLLVIDR